MARMSNAAFTKKTNHLPVGGYAGATRNVHTGEEVSPGKSKGYIVGVEGAHEREIENKPVTVGDVESHRRSIASDSSLAGDHSVTQGSWTKGPQGAEPHDHMHTWLDQGHHITGRGDVHDLAHAMSMGHANHQQAIFDLQANHGSGGDINVNPRTVASAQVGGRVQTRLDAQPAGGIQTTRHRAPRPRV